MKARLTSFAAACALALALGAVSAFAATKTVTIRVKGMKCGNCSSSVAKALKATQGVQDAQVSPEKGEAVVTFDDEKVTEAKLREVIDSTGFKSETE
jgi:periplasmic mercuric ion binding protein